MPFLKFIRENQLIGEEKDNAKYEKQKFPLWYYA